jgi:hypothetical protein
MQWFTPVIPATREVVSRRMIVLKNKLKSWGCGSSGRGPRQGRKKERGRGSGRGKER